MPLHLSDTAFPDVKLIELRTFSDERGYFLEGFRAQNYQGLPGQNGPFVQDNFSHSKRGVLRGLHFQNPNGQGKLVRAVQGSIYDVTVDVRVGSPTFGQWQALTYGLPVLISHCTNNYGPYQFPEKLIPLMTLNAVQGKLLPLFGNGLQVRDWLHVDDHVRALMLILEKGRVGQTYNIGAHNPRPNIEVVRAVCRVLDEWHPQSRPVDARGERGSHAALIAHVEDRPGHDQRYALDARKIQTELGWAPRVSFDTGLEETVKSFLAAHGA